LAAVALAGLISGVYGKTASKAPAKAVIRNRFVRRYALVFANLNKPEELENLLAIMRRASAAGYNGIVLGPNGGQYVGLWNRKPSDSYRDAFRQATASARALRLALIPYALSPNEAGYAAPDLSEAIPCRGTEFVAHDGEATVASPDRPPLQNPGLERREGDSPLDWGRDKPGVITHVDAAIKRGGEESVRISDVGRGDPVHGLGRLYRTASVTPFRAYEFSVWMKTKDLTDANRVAFHFEGLDGGQPILYANRVSGLGAPIRPTQDWTRYAVRFNSASNSRIRLFLGIWAPRSSGSLWVDDTDLHEIGLARAVRRDSLPVVVTSEEGEPYREGVDYEVGEEKLTIPAGSKIRDGERLKISWYQRADMIGSPFANASHPRYFDVERSISRNLDALFDRPPGFMMAYDEWRIANWDPEAGKISAGEYIAQTTRRSIDMLRRINPKYDLFVWSDMFDPNENAVEKYFMCNGPVTGAWKGLSKDVSVVTWDGGAKALKFFSDRGNRQIVGGYYGSMANVKKWLDDLETAESQGAKGIDGFLYTTWDGNYSDLERVARAIKERGRWGAGTPEERGRAPSPAPAAGSESRP
jgi:hypothetical protein